MIKLGAAPAFPVECGDHGPLPLTRRPLPRSSVLVSYLVSAVCNVATIVGSCGYILASVGRVLLTPARKPSTLVFSNIVSSN